MYFSSKTIAGLLSLLCSHALAAPAEFAKRDLTSFVTSEKAIALQGALNNIGPDGVLVPGAGAGFVVASPSKVNPDCRVSVPPPREFADNDRLLHMESRFRSDVEDAH
jgi:predicted membrane-bound spermidine synthase